MKEMIEKEYGRWCQYATADQDVVRELKEMEGKEETIEDAFYRNLAFGTGGLRGVIGAGTNRMNIYTVAKASQGLANYVNENFAKKDRKIAISFDSRIKSDKFARIAADVFSANGIHVCIYSELMPTPCLSFAVRRLHCAAGIMVTASHNPAKYNGYKVYGMDGCQITTQAAEEILAEIEKIDIFSDIKGLKTAASKEGDSVREIGQIEQISQDIITDFVECVKKESLLPRDIGESEEEKAIDKNVSIVYSPLNGTGLKMVLRTLQESGYNNITVVKEQELPDGNFPTCPYPNPEIREAMELGISYAKKCNADLLLATDPDCDRVGIAVKNDEDYVLLSGNETGILLLDYVCSRRQQMGTMPEHPVMIKTIVTMDLAERIAAHYGVDTINVLTGFKFIGEQIGLLEEKNREQDYIFGFEESYGYLSGSYVRDKDAVNGTFLICEMFAYYKSQGISLPDKLQELYATYGYCLNTLHSYEFEGSVGFEKMQEIMKKFRGTINSFAGQKVLQCLDYGKGLDGLPKSDVLKFLLEGGCSVVVRPSGTEPKLKTYLSVSAKTQGEAEELEKKLTQEVEELILA
ncbi:MAG: phospho-sugar mutase [Lachnospiraceae bacterium]|nr:phospho-sugar mutase [Lachnospiraceae bacterium]